MNDKATKYGGRGRPWHPDFIKYMEFIVEHPTYAGMPDAYYEPGRIQWEAPSNRASGQFKDTHVRRLRWWQQKAKSLGISTSSDQWISRVAKRIHPTKKKPCKICGKELELRYVYPQERFLARVRKFGFVEKDLSLNRLEPIHELLYRLVKVYGTPALHAFPELFASPQVRLPSPLPASLKGWLSWLDDTYIPSEPVLMSPGAMSNAPDRFDGFHCDNLCCRGQADKGRHKANLKTYSTDRRVFEYWTEGDWVAADRLIGLLRSRFERERCRNGHPGPCDADHIGPISLGFTHRPRFQMLCSACNSAKNNRMNKSDVDLLIRDERRGVKVISWHSRPLWDACKGRVHDDENARRLSKLLRDNRHSYMYALRKISGSRAFTFLATLLELGCANYDIEFVGLRIEDHLTVYDDAIRTPRITKYAAEQKARRCRIAFKELLTYFEKSNRNAYVVRTGESDQALQGAISTLRQISRETRELDLLFLKAVSLADTDDGDMAYRSVLPVLEKFHAGAFREVFRLLRFHMVEIGHELTRRWNDERYARDLEEDDA